jgi:hypothetical protein
MSSFELSKCLFACFLGVFQVAASEPAFRSYGSVAESGTAAFQLGRFFPFRNGLRSAPSYDIIHIGGKQFGGWRVPQVPFLGTWVLIL